MKKNSGGRGGLCLYKSNLFYLNLLTSAHYQRICCSQEAAERYQELEPYAPEINGTIKAEIVNKPSTHPNYPIVAINYAATVNQNKFINP